MVSVDHSSPPPPPPPPTFVVCPNKQFISYSFSLSDDDINDMSLKPHHLSALDSSRIKTDKRKDKQLCGMCKHRTIICDYWCDTCCVAYHKECIGHPPEIKVPYHPKHPLQLHITFGGYSDMSRCNCCGEHNEGFSYSCSICDFHLHIVCAIKPNILSINYPKRHDHTLTYFPRKNSLTCDVCALGDDKCFIYTCDQCDFVVHKTCIYLPTTIRISRHDHRLSFSPYHSTPNKEDWSCGVCRKRGDKNYGGYSCSKGCNYVVHSKCGTRRDLWDGKELEGEPETEYEDIKPFEEIGDGIIDHFSHPYDHYMRLDKKENDTMDDEKRCEACILPIYEGNVYNCMKCDFMLHEACAHLPRRKWHQLHAHPLTLQVNHEGGKLICYACRYYCCGFAYVCCEPRCYFTLDVRCALVSEPFLNEVHPHPLFLRYEEGTFDDCSVCEMDDGEHLTCSKCSFDLCFSCATIPTKVKYKDDEHFLTRLYDDDTTVDIYCEICEEEIYSEVGYYKCNVCSVTLHVECLLGKDPFMKHGQSIIIKEVTLLIIPNDRLTRPICSKCERHSPYRIAFITPFGMLFCSTECIYYFGEERLFELDQEWRNGKEALNENTEYGTGRVGELHRGKIDIFRPIEP